MLTLFVQAAAQKNDVMAFRRIGVRQPISRIEGERTLQQRQRFCRALRHPRKHIGLSLQCQIIGVETVRPFALDALDLGLAQARLDRADDGSGDLVLQRENVVERRGRSVRPRDARRSPRR